jgi:NADH:ubiquinone oxidoreductase subunit 5 (subunit L)/multisubunit Na+/H+ antiporter MnhA subunit
MLIVFSVFSFSNSYMEHDIFFNRFNGLVLAFVVSMIFLILIPELLFTLIG